LNVAYVDNTLGQIRWAGQNADGSWEIMVVAARVRRGAVGLSMEYGDFSRPAIAFYDVARRELRVAEFPLGDSAFRSNLLAAGVGQSTGMAMPDVGSAPSVFAYDAAADNIQEFNNQFSAPGSKSTVVSNAGRYLSVVDTMDAALAAYVDSASGDLEVRPLTETF
jgi:hypothetical protein